GSGVDGALAAVTVTGMLVTILRLEFFPLSGESAAASPVGAVAGDATTAGVALACEFGGLAGPFWALVSHTTEPFLHAAPDIATNNATPAINQVCVCVPLSICATVLY